MDKDNRCQAHADNRRIEFTYDAAGSLLTKRMKSSTGTVLETRDYINGVEYVNAAIESIYHAEGRVRFLSGTPRYEYAIQDHSACFGVGPPKLSLRLCYTDRDSDGIVDITNDPATNEILQEVHYYPFGRKMDGPWLGSSNDIAYQYNGIEFLDDFGLEVNAATYRTLDSEIGRWWQVDPKGELMYAHTPYHSMGNSPMVHTDPNGDVLPAIAAAALIGAGVGGIFNTVAHWDDITANGGFNVGAAFRAFGVGAVAGAAGGSGRIWCSRSRLSLGCRLWSRGRTDG